MKKEIKLLSRGPSLLFLIFSLIFLFVFYFFIKDYLNKDVSVIEKRILNIEKKYLKTDINNFKKTLNLAFDIAYSETNSNLEIFLKSLIEKNLIDDNLYISKDNYIIFGKIPKNKKFHYEIYKNKYIILDFNGHKYLVYLINKNKNIFIAGLNKKYIDNLVFEKIRKYLDKININTSNYIGLLKITTFNPDKNGIFGYNYYMPPKLKEKEGTFLSINKPDVKNNYFRETYFNCMKNNKECYVSYYYKNPQTGAIEEKISYFSFIKPYNLAVFKGIYASEILYKIKKEAEEKQKELKNILYATILIYLAFMFIFYIILTLFIDRTRSKIEKEYENLVEELKRKHYYDSLTNLPNRNKLIEDLSNYDSLILMDIDDFSDINDVYGYDVGNELLKKIACELKKQYKNLYRAGSDEFVIGLNKKINEFDLCILANKEFEHELIKLSFTVSGSNKKGSLLKTAESALKVAKKKNKKCILFNDEMEKQQKERIETIQKLKEVLKKKKIIPFYQCIIGKENKYEALMRIEMDGKIVSPFVFMDLIKEAKLYNNFSQIMIEKVFNDVKNDKIENVSINLSFMDIIDNDTRNFIYNLINTCKKNHLITFEILESESIENFEIIKDFIEKVKNRGIKIAIDDFGSGYSNFIRILELQPDFIKIDGSLVKNIADKKYYEIIKLIVEFAEKFKINTVAEFVENEKIFNMLKNLGIGYFQGYYFCKPEKLDNIKN